MSLKPLRRSLRVERKVKLGERQPLPEPIEEMTVEGEASTTSCFHGAINMLSALRLDGATSRNSTPSLSRERSFENDFTFDSADDGEQGMSWQFSDDTESSGFGNSVTSFMTWTDDVEVETTRKVQELVDELERCFYGEESLDKLKKEVAAECFDWRSKYPHFRVKGAGIQSSSFQMKRLYENASTDDKMAADEATCVVLEGNVDSEKEEEEVIASHGSYQEKLELNDCCSRSDDSRPNTAEGSTVMCYGRDLSTQSLQHKAKDFIMEQLFSYVWSEVSKGLEPLLRLYSERTLQQRPIHSASLQGQRRMNNPSLPAVDTPLRAFTPVSDIRVSELDSMLCVSAKSIHRSARNTLIGSSLEPNLELDELVLSRFSKTQLVVDPVQQLGVAPTVRLPPPLSLRSANPMLAPILTLESRGYHSAADRRTRAMLSRRFSSVASGRERFLKPLEEQQTIVEKVTTTPRQVSAPSSPPSWSRHVMLPPIDNLDLPLKLQGVSLLYEPKIRSIEVRPRAKTSAKQKLQGLDLVCEPNIMSPEVSPRSNLSAKQKTLLSPINSSGPIRIQGTGLSTIHLAKKLETHEDLSLEKNGEETELHADLDSI